MKRVATMVVGVLLLAVFAGSALAALRLPQEPVNGGALQAYLNGVGESINVLTAQENIQRWQSTVSNNSTFTIQVEAGAFAPMNTVGLYNAALGAPPLYQVFPGVAAPGWFAVASFRTGPIRVIVNLFDQNAVSQGANIYLGANKTDFGFYLANPVGNIFYTQDARNPAGLAQALTYAGTGINSGSWWLCWEDLDRSVGSDDDWDDCVLFLESVNPTPVSKTTWGQLKSRFR